MYNDVKNEYYYISLIIVLAAETITIFYKFPTGSFIKLLFNFYIYFSLIFLIIYFDLTQLKKFQKLIILLFSILMVYSLFQLFRPDPEYVYLFTQKPFLAKFGNIVYGPMFLIPLFILWGVKESAIYYLEKISIVSIKIGLILFPICYFLNLNLPIVSFLPSFFLLGSYNYSNNNRKIWIILGIVASFIIFYLENYRAGILRLFLGIIAFYIIFFNAQTLRKILKILCFVLPIILIQNTISKDESFFQKISYFLSDTEYKNLTMDTRTFLYKETIDDMSLNKKMLLGKGPLGSYYSPFFGNLGFTDIYGSPDHYIRSSVEVGLLHMLLKGGLIYILLVTLFYIYISLQKCNNNYSKYLSITCSLFFLILIIENRPYFDFLNAVIWIMIGILCSNKKELNELEIKNQIFKQDKNIN